MGTPIINLPQTGMYTPRVLVFLSTRSLMIAVTAVLGLHAIKEKPVAIDGKIEIRPVSIKCYRIVYSAESFLF